MALTNEHKIYVALAVLAGVGGGVWYVQQQEKKEDLKYIAGASSGTLPELKLPADDVERITKISLKSADKPEVVLEKDGDKWRVKKPVDYPANQANVKSLLDNLKELKAKDVIDKSAASYAEYNLDDAKATHIVAYKGGDKAIDLYFGKSGGRGQMTRKGGTDGIYAVGGYSAYLYARDVKNWRDTSLLKFDDAAVTRVDLKNETGDFVFKKDGESWTGTLKGEKIDRFDENKVKDMLRAYKALNADDFADDKTDADTGLDKPAANLTFTLKEGDPIKLAVGKTSSGESRYLKKEGTPQAFVISSWSAGWATAKADKFQKPEDKKDGGAAAPGADDEMGGDKKKKDDKKDDKKKDDKKKDDKKK